MSELSGRVAIVTGGAAGLGRGISERFAAAGARVVVADVDEERGRVVASGPAFAFRRTDVANPDEMRDLVAYAVDTFGGLHVMVNNAGVSGAMHAAFLDDDFADFDRVMAINVLGVMAGTQHAARHMAANGGGSIVNVTSIGGITAGRGVMSYRASKAAVIHLSKSVAIDLAEHGVRVNCIAPGNIPTELLASSMDDESTAPYRAVMNMTRPLRKTGTPADVAEAALYLASDRSAYVTGAVLAVDGGSSAGFPLTMPDLLRAAGTTVG
ncbi:SDR family NAD(P)-dependent oxidoreductase [Fodinicola acaciae]|uniref:SDR family NAD(P)-dependent oxidoreductase n=1 Tax=Fodinicola acaciae TaxID=2681555 RepID=UPI0013D08BC7|nr:glucose 1-dehydrogenase [Fodinicola acaciae]